MKLYTSIFLIAIIFLFSDCSDNKAKKDRPDTSYKIETIKTPEGLSPETGGIDFLPDGRLAACFLRGEVMFYNPKTGGWNLFAEGLHEPLGILAVKNSEIMVMQRPELTRVSDTDGDGEADAYETLTDDFGITGNYHEFAYGPVEDKEGNIFIALNAASSGGGINPEVRGRLDTMGRGAGGMYSVVPYRGWVMELTKTGILRPYASGFRSPNGLGFDQEGNLFATDNQGDWVGTSKLFHIKEGNFYGHPAGLIWRKDWSKGNPFNLPLPELDSMRTRAAVLFPQDIIANSPTQPLCDVTKGKFGPFSGQLFVGEMNSERLVRVILEKIDGEIQGACIPFLDGKGLRKGNNRLAFAPDGSLWVGQVVKRGWLGENGLQRIVFTGKQPADILSMNLTREGFDLTFTQPVDSGALNKENYKIQRYYYEYHAKYGSDRMDLTPVPVTKLDISEDRRKVSLTLDSLKRGYIYQLDLGDVRTVSGDTLDNHVICYTLNNLIPPR